MAIVPIAKGEQITLSKLSRPTYRRSLASAVPVGKRAVTVYLDNIASLYGLLRPGDYVDIISIVPIPVGVKNGKTITNPTVIPLFQKVLVLAVGPNVGGVKPIKPKKSRSSFLGFISSEPKHQSSTAKSSKDKAAHYITLALSPEEANYIALVQQQGRLQLILRSSADSETVPLKPASVDNLLQYLGFYNKVPKKIPETIEVYKGTKKEIIPIRKR
jgi:Flp pilus assembly protein CpaB